MPPDRGGLASVSPVHGCPEFGLSIVPSYPAAPALILSPAACLEKDFSSPSAFPLPPTLHARHLFHGGKGPGLAQTKVSTLVQLLPIWVYWASIVFWEFLDVRAAVVITAVTIYTPRRQMGSKGVRTLGLISGDSALDSGTTTGEED